MIDLRNDRLPDCLDVGGELFDIDTSFRTWIKFGCILEKDRYAWSGIFKERAPVGDEWVEQAVEFYACRNELPRVSPSDSISEKEFDFVLDGDYIVAAYQQAYGIDLTDPELDMHWHRFLALFRGMPDSTVLSRIRGCRAWRKSKRDHDSVMAEMKRAWAIPDSSAEEEKARVLELFNEMYS